MLVFPNATVRADKHDADYWLSQANMDAAPKDAKGSFQGAMASLNPYIAAGKFKPFDGATELVPGVRAMPSHGTHARGTRPMSSKARAKSWSCGATSCTSPRCSFPSRR